MKEEASFVTASSRVCLVFSFSAVPERRPSRAVLFAQQPSAHIAG